MKGRLHKLSKGWTIWYNDDHIGGNVSFVDSLPLHPDDVKEIEEWLFDNSGVEYHSQEVEFEMTYHWDETIPQPISVGRLIKTKEEKDKETLYTEEQVRKVIEQSYSLGSAYRGVYSKKLENEIIQSLKQTKQ
jgi:hypothetical protein